LDVLEFDRLLQHVDDSIKRAGVSYLAKKYAARAQLCWVCKQTLAALLLYQQPMIPKPITITNTMAMIPLYDELPSTKSATHHNRMEPK
jgi:hypothetical protein